MAPLKGDGEFRRAECVSLLDEADIVVTNPPLVIGGGCTPIQGPAFATDELERRTVELMLDPDLTKHSGIYGYLLTGEERHLNIRQFEDREKRAAYERQNHECANGTHCRTPGNGEGQHVFEMPEMEMSVIATGQPPATTLASGTASTP